jgi:hypothetical protein
LSRGCGSVRDSGFALRSETTCSVELVPGIDPAHLSGTAATDVQGASQERPRCRPGRLEPQVKLSDAGRRSKLWGLHCVIGSVKPAR